MLRKLFAIINLFSVLLLFNSCRDDNFGVASDGDLSDGIPVEFEIEIDGMPATRGLDFPKKKFEDLDLIHIHARFEMTSGDPQNRYGVLQYDGSTQKWVMPDLEGVQPLRWPNNATSGVFRAFYIPGSQAPLSKGSVSDIGYLSDISGTSEGDTDRDPLQSVKNAEEKYGHTVRLKFEHACAYLIIEEIPYGVADEFCFYKRSEPADNEMKNAYRLALSDDNQLQLQFLSKDDNGQVYVKGKAYEEKFEDGVKNCVGFFLPPDTYNSFILGYKGYSKIEDYISYTKSLERDGGSSGEAEDDESVKEELKENKLEANNVYTFNVARSSGITRQDDNAGEKWDVNGSYWVIVDPCEFLWSASNALEYKEWDKNANDSVLVLEKIADRTVRLKRNIDMQNAKYSVFGPDSNHPDFEPNIGNGNIFDGGRHYIRNIGSPLFRTNGGIIKDVGLKNIDIEVDAYNKERNEAEIKNRNRQGALCVYNNGGGEITNIQFFGPTKLTVNIKSKSSQENLYIGGIVGTNLGKISKIFLNDVFEIELRNSDDPETEVSVGELHVGGLAGTVSEGGSLWDVSALSGDYELTSPQLKIMNLCEGEGASYYLGGLVGSITNGTVSDIMIPTLEIDSQRSIGLISRIGGAAGLITDDAGGLLSFTKVIGSVKAGKSASHTITDESGRPTEYRGEAFTAGLVGQYGFSASVENCVSIVSVYGPAGENYDSEDDVVYATGGIFGKMTDSSVKGSIYNLISNGETISGPEEYIGTFAGIAPRSTPWSYFDDKDVTVNNIDDIDPIGENQN